MSNKATGFSLTVLGADGSYPGPGGACSGYLLRAAGFSIWMEAGPGSLANLQAHIDLSELDAVVVSHGHPDHWSDLQGLYVAMRYFFDRRGLPIYAPEGIAELADGQGEGAVFDWHITKEGASAAIGPFSWTWSRTVHPAETLAARVEAEGRALGFSADTGPEWRLRQLGEGLDVALVEASTTSQQEGSWLHLSAAEAGESAREAGARHLLITHLTPRVDRELAKAEASEAFGREAEVAVVGRTWAV